MPTVTQKIFVGREADLQWLLELLLKTRTGTGQFVLVEGEAGIGKTQLFHECVRGISSGELIMATGKCPQFTGALPYQPFHDILKQLIHTAPDTLRARIQEKIGPIPQTILAFFPEIKDLLPAAEEVELEDRRALPRLLSIFTQLIISFAHPSRPLFLIIDDLQWIDEGSLALLAALVKQIASVPILLAGAFRTEEVDKEHPLQIMIDSLTEEGFPPFRWRLTPLSLNAVREITQRYYDVPLPPQPEIAQAVTQVCAGNPFYLWQFLQEARESGALLSLGNTWALDSSRIGPRLDNVGPALVQKRFHRLPSSTQRVLQVAAIVERGITPKILKFLVPQNGNSIEEHLHHAIDAGFLLRQANGETQYQFLHDRLIESIRGTMPEKEQTELHGRIAHYFESTQTEGSDEARYRIAYHYLKSGQQERALPELYAAGKLALSRYAHHDAAQFFSEAIRIWRLMPEAERPQNFTFEEMQENLGNAWMLGGQYQRAISCFEIALQDAPDVLKRVGLLTKIGTAYFHSGLFQESYNYLAQALDIFRIRIPRTEAGAVSKLAIEFLKYHFLRYLPPILLRPFLRRSQMELQIMQDLLNRMSYFNYFYSALTALLAHYHALVNGILLQPCHERVETVGLHAGLIGAVGHYGIARRAAEEALRMSDQLRDPYAKYKTYFYWGFGAFSSGYWEDCEFAFHQAVELFPRVGDWFFLETTLIMLQFLYSFQGRLKEWEDIVFRHREAALVTSDLRARVVDAFLSAHQKAIHGNFSEAYILIALGKKLEEQFAADRLVTETSRQEETRVLLLDRKYAEAEATITEAVGLIWDTRIYQTFDIPVYPLLLEASLYIQKGGEIDPRLQGAVTRVHKLAKQIRWAEGLAWRTSALFNLIEEDPSGAQSDFKKSNALLSKFGMKYEIAHNHALMAKWGLDPDGSHKQIAIQELEALGAPYEAQLLKEGHEERRTI